ncbi:FtsX-like permease family protein [Dactylosporangium sp. NPDC000555]|uniref:FtsX-like permease family protein n=1 Tax=Dactylosporangium sp. NPDC000555 TaxID=3154260 RepID=UPI003332C9F5
MRPAGVLRFAFAGTRTDRARVSITAAGAAVAVLVLLCCATVMTIEPESGRYQSRMFTANTILPNTVLAMLLFSIPIMFLVAQSARLGAPARDRRLAAFRMAGASPAQIGWIAAVETGLAATIGAALGAAAYFAGRVLLDNPGPDGRRPLPTDVLPTRPAAIGIVIGVPLLATLLTVVLLRRVAITPFGVVRQSRQQRVRAWPMLLLVLGLAGMTGMSAAMRSEYVRQGRLDPTQAYNLLILVLLACTILVLLGLMFTVAWIGYTGARLLLRVTRRPSALIAARQVLADPYDCSRSYTVILVTTAFGAAGMMLHSWMLTEVAVRAAAIRDAALAYGTPSTDLSGTAAFRSDVHDIVNAVLLGIIGVAALTLLIALVESGVARRRAIAALVAGGTPRAVLARAMYWRVLIPAVPGIAIAGLAGMLAMRSFTATATAGWGGPVCVGTPAQCAGDDAGNYMEYRSVTHTFQTPVPWGEIGAIASASLLAVLLVIAASLLLQRSSTNPSELRAD